MPKYSGRGTTFALGLRSPYFKYILLIAAALELRSVTLLLILSNPQQIFDILGLPLTDTPFWYTNPVVDVLRALLVVSIVLGIDKLRLAQACRGDLHLGALFTIARKLVKFRNYRRLTLAVDKAILEVFWALVLMWLLVEVVPFIAIMTKAIIFSLIEFFLEILIYIADMRTGEWGKPKSRRRYTGPTPWYDLFDIPFVYY